MKPTITLTFALTILLFAGCKKEPPAAESSQAPSQPADTASDSFDAVNDAIADASKENEVTTEDIKKELGEAAGTTGKYLDQKKDQWLAAAEAKLRELEEQASELKAIAAQKKDQWSEQAKATWAETLLELEKHRETAKAKLAELKEKSGPLLEKTSEEFSSAAEKAKGLWTKMKAKVHEMTAEEPAEASPEDTPPDK